MKKNLTMKSIKVFCGSCSSKHVPQILPHNFDEETGKNKIVSACPNPDCRDNKYSHVCTGGQGNRCLCGKIVNHEE